MIDAVAIIVGVMAAVVGTAISIWTLAMKLERRRQEVRDAKTLRIVHREPLPGYGPIDYRYTFSDGRSLRVWRTADGGRVCATDMDTVESGDAVYGEHITLIEQTD